MSKNSSTKSQVQGQNTYTEFLFFKSIINNSTPIQNLEKQWMIPSDGGDTEDVQTQEGYPKSSQLDH